MLKRILVIAATGAVIVFNWLAAAGYINDVTPEIVSAKYPTLVTPAGYAFGIWSLIYFGMIVFSIYQALPKNTERFSGVRSLYILSCAANCAWIFFWHHEQVVVCLFIILALLASLLVINIKVKNGETMGRFWLVKAPFGIYFGWVTVASMVNFVIVLKYLNAGLSESSETILSSTSILLAAVFGVLARVKLANYFYPLAIAWAVTAIAVKQGGYTLIVVSAAVACIVSLFTALSFVLTTATSNVTPASRRLS
jgi:benzodiazapine receptor